MGVIDETGTLPAGTFWASFTRISDSPSNLIEPSTEPPNTQPRALPAGTRAIVGRAPHMDPAHIRIMHAADPAVLPASLKSLKNVLVFPQQGNRPIQCEMDGGDLDGDQYFIIWEPELIPKKELPALPPVTPVVVGSNKASSDTPSTSATRAATAGYNFKSNEIEFFWKYVRNDLVAKIAVGHLAVSDLLPDLANSSKARELVMQHSIANDFAKHGTPAKIGRVSELLKDVVYPDFLGGKRRSNTIVGVITRDAKGKAEAAAAAAATAEAQEVGGIHTSLGNDVSHSRAIAVDSPALEQDCELFLGTTTGEGGSCVNAGVQHSVESVEEVAPMVTAMAQASPNSQGHNSPGCFPTTFMKESRFHESHVSRAAAEDEGCVLCEGGGGMREGDRHGAGGDASPHHDVTEWPEVDKAFMIEGSEGWRGWAERVLEQWTVDMSETMRTCVRQSF